MNRQNISLPSIMIKMLVMNIFDQIEKMCSQVPLDDPRKCPQAEEWDGMTVESWAKQNAWSQGY